MWVVLGVLGKPTEEVIRNKSVSSTPQGLRIRFCLRVAALFEFLP